MIGLESYHSVPWWDNPNLSKRLQAKKHFRRKFERKAFDTKPSKTISHLNRDKIESNLSVPEIQEHQENALIKSFEMRPHLKRL